MQHGLHELQIVCKCSGNGYHEHCVLEHFRETAACPLNPKQDTAPKDIARCIKGERNRDQTLFFPPFHHVLRFVKLGLVRLIKISGGWRFKHTSERE